jgi:hypothetical protein
VWNWDMHVYIYARRHYFTLQVECSGWMVELKCDQRNWTIKIPSITQLPWLCSQQMNLVIYFEKFNKLYHHSNCSWFKDSTNNTLKTYEKNGEYYFLFCSPHLVHKHHQLFFTFISSCLFDLQISCHKFCIYAKNNNHIMEKSSNLLITPFFVFLCLVCVYLISMAKITWPQGSLCSTFYIKEAQAVLPIMNLVSISSLFAPQWMYQFPFPIHTSNRTVSLHICSEMSW